MPEEKETNGDGRAHAVELTLNTPPERMSEMTSLNRRETFIYPIMEMMDKIGDFNRKPGFLMSVYRESSYRHKRSLGAQQLIGAHKMALGEIASEGREEDEGNPEDE